MMNGWYAKVANYDMLTKSIIMCLHNSIHDFDTISINRILNSFLSQADLTLAIDKSLRNAVSYCVKQQQIGLTESQQRCLAYIQYVCSNTEYIQPKDFNSKITIIHNQPEKNNNLIEKSVPLDVQQNPKENEIDEV